MYDLEKISQIIDYEDVFFAKDQTEFYSYGLYRYIFDITIKAAEGTNVEILVGNEVIETGIVRNGVYSVRAFRDTPFPFLLYKTLNIRAADDYLVDFKYCKYETLLAHAIYQIGAYYVTNNKMINMKGFNVWITPYNGECDIKDTSAEESDMKDASTEENDWVVLECAKLNNALERCEFEWLRYYAVPSVSQKYAMIALDNLNMLLPVPKLVISKEKAALLANAGVELKYTNENPSDILKWNREFIQKMIDLLAFKLLK